MDNISYIENMLKNTSILSAIINNNSFDVFMKYKGDKMTEEEINFYKELEITDMEEHYYDDLDEDEFETEFNGYSIEVKYNWESFTIRVNENDDVEVY